MKSLIIASLALGSLIAHAGTELNCRSANYRLTMTSDSSGNVLYANYAINSRLNDGADVVVEKIYASKRVVAASFTVDGVADKFELSVAKNARGVFEGRIFTGKFIQNAACTTKYVVTSDDRDDEAGNNL